MDSEYCPICGIKINTDEKTSVHILLEKVKNHWLIILMIPVIVLLVIIGVRLAILNRNNKVVLSKPGEDTDIISQNATTNIPAVLTPSDLQEQQTIAAEPYLTEDEFIERINHQLRTEYYMIDKKTQQKANDGTSYYFVTDMSGNSVGPQIMFREKDTHVISVDTCLFTNGTRALDAKAAVEYGIVYVWESLYGKTSNVNSILNKIRQLPDEKEETYNGIRYYVVNDYDYPYLCFYSRNMH